MEKKITLTAEALDQYAREGHDAYSQVKEDKTSITNMLNAARGWKQHLQIDALSTLADQGWWRLGTSKDMSRGNNYGYLLILADYAPKVHQYYFGELDPSTWQTPVDDKHANIYTRYYLDGSWTEWKRYGDGGDNTRTAPVILGGVVSGVEVEAGSSEDVDYVVWDTELMALLGCKSSVIKKYYNNWGTASSFGTQSGSFWIPFENVFYVAGTALYIGRNSFLISLSGDIPLATTERDGLMSHEDKAKLAELDAKISGVDAQLQTILGDE